MSDQIAETRSRLLAELTIRLDCGHEISVPGGYSSPAAIPFVVQHRDLCEAPSTDLSGMAWWAAPLSRAPVASFR
ncbi:MAG: hypothetical protein WBG19_08995 [Thermoplasmata archaeon]